MAISNVLISVLAIIFVAQIIPSNGQSCYLQQCLNCQNTVAVGSRTACTYTNNVNPSWFYSLTMTPGPAVPNKIPFRCITFVSSSPVTLPHVLRGCSLGDDNGARQMCNQLSQHQGHGRTGICSYCQGNNCNSAASKGPLLSLLVVAVSAKLFFALI